MDDAEIMREENRQLEVTARIHRSQVAFEKTLKEMCMDHIFKNDQRLLNSINGLSPAIRREFFKKLEQRSFKTDESTKWTDEEFQPVQQLLDESIAEFDFKIFRGDFQRDQQTWRLLSEKCPNLRRVEDRRWRGRGAVVVELDVFPELLSLKNLQHIELQSLKCSGQDVARLVRNFPDLRSLAFSVNFQHLNYELRLNLFKLQELQFLQITLDGYKDTKDTIICEFRAGDLMAECLLHLPALQEVTIEFEQATRNGWRTFQACHNDRFEAPRKPLALRSVSLRGTVKGWSPEHLPHLTKLSLHGDLENLDEFSAFGDVVTVLEFVEYRPEDVERVLSSGCFRGLEELELETKRTWGDTPRGFDSRVDPYLIFHFCPTLKVLRWPDLKFIDGPEVYPVSARNFEHLREVRILNEWCGQDAHLMSLILAAPRVVELVLLNISLRPEEMHWLMERIEKREVMQRLRRLEIDFYQRDSDEVKETIVRFLKLIPCYAPRVEEIKLWDDYYNKEYEPAFEKMQIKALNVPNFRFVGPLPHECGVIV